jgi:hypothetical protein
VSAELDRLRAAQAKADEVIRAVGEPAGPGPRLRVAVTDVETGQRLATGFVNYGELSRRLRLVNQRSQHPLPK